MKFGFPLFHFYLDTRAILSYYLINLKVYELLFNIVHFYNIIS